MAKPGAGAICIAPRSRLIKYAISQAFDDFILDVIRWKVNLNKVDASDDGTALDYLDKHIKRNKGNDALEKKFQYYYNPLRTAGAKYKSELQ